MIETNIMYNVHIVYMIHVTYFNRLFNLLNLDISFFLGCSGAGDIAQNPLDTASDVNIAEPDIQPNSEVVMIHDTDEANLDSKMDESSSELIEDPVDNQCDPLATATATSSSTTTVKATTVPSTNDVDSSMTSSIDQIVTSDRDNILVSPSVTLITSPKDLDSSAVNKELDDTRKDDDNRVAPVDDITDGKSEKDVIHVATENLVISASNEERTFSESGAGAASDNVDANEQDDSIVDEKVNDILVEEEEEVGDSKLETLNEGG